MYKFITIFSLSFFVFSSCINTTKNSSPQSEISELGVKDKYTLAFYNVENLFDTERDTNIYDEEFTPASPKQWDESKYNKKINNISYVIKKMAEENNAEEGIAIIGLAEIENNKVLNDLINNKQISTFGYKYVHYDSPDPRGIDVALLYNPSLFQLSTSKTYTFKHPKNKNYKTRDILLVCGFLGQEKVNFIVNHWPSRKGENNAELRDHAARLCKSITDSLFIQDKDSKIIIMGDLNDNPDNRSCRVILQAKQEQKDVTEKGLYNTLWPEYKKGMGSNRYQNKWDMFDQIIISHSLLHDNNLRYKNAFVFNKDFLFQKNGKYKGYPLRTFTGNTFLNGYSDHLPVILNLERHKVVNEL